MVITRHKSTITYKEASDDESDMEDSTTWEPSRKRKGPNDQEDEEYGKLKRKRRRPFANSAESKGRGKMKARQLMKSFFDILPLDLALEIFSHLRPIDLLQLTRTNKLLRSYLMRKSSSFVWVAARHNESPPPPDCPPDQSEPQWAHLIYTRECMICGRLRARKMDWFLCIRGCERCLKANIFTRINAMKWFNDIEDVDAVLELIPYTYTGGWAHGHASNTEFYLKGHIVKMAEKLQEYQARVDAGVPGAWADLKGFVARKKEEVPAILAGAPALKRWAEEARKMKRHLDEHLKELRQSAMKAKLLELGHLEEDIDAATESATIFNSTAELTEPRWKTVRVKAEDAVNDAKRQRISAHRQGVFQRRREVLGQAFKSFSTENPAPRNGLVPDDEDLILAPIIDDIIHKDGDDLPSTDDFMPLFPEAMQQWVKMVKSELNKKVMDEGGLPVSEPPTESELDRLPLAVTTFFCSNSWQGDRQIVFIDDEIREHRCWRWRQPTSSYPLECLNFNSGKSAIARELVLLSGLDPESATREDMDAVNARFLCGVCMGEAGRLARHWRNCLDHVDDHTSGADTSWTKLNEEDTQRICLIEDDTQNTYHCNVCKTRLQGGGAAAKEHFENKHGGASGSTDFVLNMESIQRPLCIDKSAAEIIGQLYPWSSYSPYKCLLCAGTPRYFRRYDLHDHVKQKHGFRDEQLEWSRNGNIEILTIVGDAETILSEYVSGAPSPRAGSEASAFGMFGLFGSGSPL